MIDATTVYFLSTQTPGQICTEAPPTVKLGDKKSLHYLDKYFYCKLNHDSTKIVMNLGTLSCCEHIEMIRVMIPVFDTFLNITAPVLFKYQSCAVYTTQLTFQS